MVLWNFSHWTICQTIELARFPCEQQHSLLQCLYTPSSVKQRETPHGNLQGRHPPALSTQVCLCCKGKTISSLILCANQDSNSSAYLHRYSNEDSVLTTLTYTPPVVYSRGICHCHPQLEIRAGAINTSSPPSHRKIHQRKKGLIWKNTRHTGRSLPARNCERGKTHFCSCDMQRY